VLQASDVIGVFDDDPSVTTTSDDGLVTTVDKFGDGTHITKKLNMVLTEAEVREALANDASAL